MTNISTTCPYCGVGCGVQVEKDTELIAVEGSSAHPANHGRLCVKGSHLLDTVTDENRLLYPEVRRRRVAWEDALQTVADTFRQVIDEHGPGATAMYLSGQLLTEDYYVANKLMKGFIGSANVDTNSRLCMSSAVSAHKRSFGEDVVPVTYDDVEKSRLIVLSGSNAAWAHPVLYQRIMAAREQRGTQVVVIDPRRTPTAETADIHLQIRPGSDSALFNGLLTYLAESGSVDDSFIRNHTNHATQVFADNRLSLEEAASITAISVSQLTTFYQAFAAEPKTISLFSQGVNQSANGTNHCNAIINCHLATGRIGQPGQGPFSITGQPNAMGGREVGGLATQLAAHMDFEPASVARVRKFWDAPNIARAPGLKAVELFEAMADGEIQAVWIMGTNPAVSLPNSSQVHAALARCPFVVVSDCVKATDTNQYADVLLPARGWGEKDGTVTNSERCISRQRAICEPRGEARDDWQIVSEVAKKLGHGAHFEFTSAAEIFDEHTRLTAYENDGQRVLNLKHLTGLSQRRYEDLEPTYWPASARPFHDRQFSTPNRRANFVATAIAPLAAAVSSDRPFILNSGRLRDQWHTMTRTGVASRLFRHQPLPALQISVEDAKALKVESGDVLELANAFGSARLLADPVSGLRPGELFAPIHWNRQYSGSATINALYPPVTDPISGQPQSKQIGVSCRRVFAPWHARIVSSERFDNKTLNTLTGLLFWARVPLSEGEGLELAVENSAVVNQLIPPQTATMHGGNGEQRFLARSASQQAAGCVASMCKTLPAFETLAESLNRSEPDWLRLTTADGTSTRSPTVCTCFEVSRAQIAQAIERGEKSLHQLGVTLGCGTNCGSCVPELKELLSQSLKPHSVRVGQS